MSRNPRLVLVALTGLLWFLANTPASADPWSHDPRQNTLVAAGPRGQCVSAMCTDGHEGAFIIYVDPCSVYTTIPASIPWVTFHAEHVLKDGDFDPAWPLNG